MEQLEKKTHQHILHQKAGQLLVVSQVVEQHRLWQHWQ